jgi:hypothetical protein
LDIDDLPAVLNSAMMCFQHARKYFDEAKKIPTMTPSLPLLDGHAGKWLTGLTKVCRCRV